MKLPQPRYPYFVQVSSMQEIPEHTRNFLLEHATIPLEQISVSDTNDFLLRCYQRSSFAGEAYSMNKVPE